jgi:Mn2+/Fe2+ NRAMP family transporter
VAVRHRPESKKPRVPFERLFDPGSTIRSVPLTSTYAACEAFGWEAGLDDCWGAAPASYGLLAFFVGFAALFVLIPGLPLITVIFLSQVFDGLLLPIILVFVMLLARDRNLMGELVSS